MPLRLLNIRLLSLFPTTVDTALYSFLEPESGYSRENWCKAHVQYQEVLTEHANAVERETALYWKLKLAETHIEVWRTIQASRRREAQIL